MTVSLVWCAHLLLIAMRLSLLFIFSPIQALRVLPMQVRTLLLFSFSGLLLFTSSPPNTLDNLLLQCIAEFIQGLWLVLGLYAAFSVYQIGGQLIDNQLGLNAIAFFKPDEPGQESISARLLSMLAVLCFFGSHYHLLMFKGLTYSLVIIPLGSMPIGSGVLPVIKQFGFMFQMAFILASPLVISLLTLDFCFALVTRTMPQMNTYFLVMPLKIVLGLLILVGLLPYLIFFNDSVMHEWIGLWQGVLS